MKVVALVSGGRESILNAILCHKFGHSIEALAHIKSLSQSSKMYQAVGQEVVELQAKSLQLPLFMQESQGIAVNQQSDYFYEGQEGESAKSKTVVRDEAEDLYSLLLKVKQQAPQINAVCSGVVRSDYKRKRIENVCSRLGLSSLAFLWNQSQMYILQQALDHKIRAILIQIAQLGLNKTHLGTQITQQLIEQELKGIFDKYKVDFSEYSNYIQSLVLDCPYFSKSINIQSSEIVESLGTIYLKIKKAELIEKNEPFQSLKREFLQAQQPPQAQLIDPSHIVQPAFNQKIQIFENGDWFFVDQLSASNFINQPKKFQGIEEEVRFVFANLQQLLAQSGKSLNQVFFVNLYISDMSLYGIINKVYNSYFNFPNPPARVCVQLQLPQQQNATFYIQCNGFRPVQQKQVIHVQSISQWVPANIGPYSQCQTMQGRTFLAGSIPFVPHTMGLADSQSCVQVTCQNIIKIMQEAKVQSLDYCILFYSEKFLQTAQQLQNCVAQIRKLFNDQQLIITCISNPMLPKASQIELCVAGKTYNFSKQYIQQTQGDYLYQALYSDNSYNYTVYAESESLNLGQFLSKARETIISINKGVTQNLNSPSSNQSQEAINYLTEIKFFIKDTLINENVHKAIREQFPAGALSLIPVISIGSNKNAKFAALLIGSDSKQQGASKQ